MKQDLIERAEQIAGFGFWEYFLDENRVVASANALRIYGINPEKPLTLSDIQQLPLPEYRPILDQALSDLISGLKPYNVIFKIKRGVDNRIAIIHSEAEYDAANQRVFGIIKDITRHTQTEEALRDSEKRYRLLAENANDVIWLMSLDGRFTYVSPSVVQLRGYTPEEVLNQTIEEAVCPESIAAVKNALSRAVVSINNQSPVSEANYYPVAQPRKDGSTVWTEVSASLIYENGQPSHILGVSRDITARKQAEDDLQEREAKLKAIFSTAPIGIAVVTNLVITEINDAVCRISGYSREELIGQYARLVYPSDEEFERVGAEIYRQLAEKSIASLEAFIRRKDGSLLPVLYSVSPLEPGGTPQSFVFTATDISEQKKAEETLRQSEEKYRQLFNSVSDAIYFHQTDQDGRGRFIEVNDGATRLMGYTREEFLKMSPRELDDPDNTEDAAEVRQKMLLDGHVVFERIHVAKDDRRIPVEINSQSVTIDDRTMYLSVVRDVTERKTMESQLLQAAEQWRATFDAITTPVSIQDRNYRILRVNQAFADAFHKTPQELIGKTCFEISHGTTEPVATCPHRRTLESGRVEEVEIHNAEKGTYSLVSTYPMFGPDGEVIVSVHITQDITERMKMQEQLMVTNRLASVGELAAGIAHEINNPLTGILGFSELLLETDLPDYVRRDVETIYSEARRSAEIIKNLLVFARRHHQVRDLVNVNEVIQRVLELRAYDTKLNNIEVITRLASDLPEITADYFQLQQVFLNIVINAEFFMLKAHKKGILQISTRFLEGKDRVEITFADDGPGIAPENLERLFDPFFTTKEVDQGTGLGLSISHGVIKQHGGSIKVESTPGKGASFIIELPLTAPAEAPPETGG